jgi:DNA polymerase III, delta subunit
VRAEEVLAALAGDLPPALLVRGPGAWDLAVSAAEPGWETARRLDAARAREVRATAWLLPSGSRRVFLLNLDGASPAVQNSLLKVLEEPPDTSRFVLTATRPVLPTVASRCRQMTLGGAREASPDDGPARAAVAAAVRAACSGQSAALAQAVRGWWKDAPPGGPPHPRLLARWAAEAAAGRWVQFGPDFAPEASARQAAQLLAELARYRDSRMAALTALDRVFCPG